VLNNPLLSTAYLAPITYYAILLQNKNCKIENHEHFIKQSIRNRCEIYSANGKLRLTIPKKNKQISKKKITDIKIAYEEKWQREHWHAIVSAYNSSPFFKYYQDKIKPQYENKEIYLIDFNNKLQEIILNILQLNKVCKKTNKYNHTGNFTDLRNYNFNYQNIKKYDQVFMEKHGFIQNLSILDLLFNLGPETRDYLYNIDTNHEI